MPSKPNTSQTSRRGFLQTTAATSFGAYFSGVAASTGWAADFKSPNEQPGIAFVGTGIRYHTYHGKQAMKFGPCIGIADVDGVHGPTALSQPRNSCVTDCQAIVHGRVHRLPIRGNL